MRKTTVLAIALLIGCSVNRGEYIGELKHFEGTASEVCPRLFSAEEWEHIIDFVDEPALVRVMKGSVKPIESSSWDPDSPATIVLRKISGDLWNLSLNVATDGRFLIDSATNGLYCFKAKSIGFQSAIGLIEVSESAPPDAEVFIELLLGV